MILEVYAVHDKAVGAFTRPFFVRSKGEAVRSFIQACMDEKSEFSRNAGDYVLFELGTFDDGEGLFSLQEPVRVLSALEAVVAGSRTDKV